MKPTNPFYLDPKCVVASFNKAAKTYDDVAVLSREIDERMIDRLDVMKIDPKRILDIGIGTGYTTALLEKKYPQATIFGVDFAADMLKVAKQKVTASTKQQLICADTRRLPIPDDSVDIVISNLMLHWSSDLYGVLQEWRRVLRPEGLLMFSTYGPETLKELRQSWAQVDSNIHVNGFVDMRDLGNALLHAKFVEPVMDIDYFTLRYPNVKLLMNELKLLGEHNINQGRSRYLTGKSKLQKMIDAYQAFQTDRHKIPATYEVIYGHAWKATENSTPIRRGE